MEVFNRILNKSIAVISRTGYIEGSYTDLYVQRLIKIYGHPQSKVLREYCDKGMTGINITTQVVTSDDTAKPPMLAPLVKS